MTQIVLRSVAAIKSVGVRFASQAAAPAAASVAAPVDPEHKAWLAQVAKYPVKIPTYHWTLEWALPTPVPLHQFTQSPIVIEVKDRNPNPDDLQYSGPNVIGGYTHPDTGKAVSLDEHVTVMKTYASFDAGSKPTYNE